MSLEFVINGEASVGAWEKPGSLQLHAPNGGNLTVDGPLGGAFLIPRPLAVVDYFVPQSKWPLPRSLRASEPVDPRERGRNDGAVSEQSQLCGRLSFPD